MTAAHESQILALRLGIPFDAADTLRRAQLTLHRWAELECGDGNDYASWAIEYDEESAKVYKTVYPHDGSPTMRYAIVNQETGALRRVAKVCKEYGLYYFHQTDPRGCALYVSREPLNPTNYNTKGFPVCV